MQQALFKILDGTMASVPHQGGRKHPQQELLQIDTTNILFICGGAFDGLEKIIENRNGKTAIGFGAEVLEKTEKNVGEWLKLALPEDLVKFGLIPEFVGRLPVVVSLDMLDEAALVKILTEPRNALVKQYQKLFELDGVELSFTPEALTEIARLAQSRKTGARGLRAIVESAMMDTMYQIPSDNTIGTCLITKETVEGKAKPELTYRDVDVVLPDKKERTRRFLGKSGESA